MTRSGARELAVHLLFDIDCTKNDVEQVLNDRLNKEYYNTLGETVELYAEYPGKSQLQYIKKVVNGVCENRDELDEVISKYAVDWKLSRIAKITRTILELSIFEIKNLEDVPASVAVNEAVNLTKKYDSPDAASFVNGILGSFIRGEEAK